MKTLTLHGPWAWAVMQGLKRVENRAQAFSYRGPLYIHAGTSTKSDAAARELFASLGIEPPVEFPRGLILGTVQMVDVIRFSREQSPLRRFAAGLVDLCFPAAMDAEQLAADPFAVGPYCLVFENPRKLERPVPARGSLSFWNWNAGDFQRANSLTNPPKGR